MGFQRMPAATAILAHHLRLLLVLVPTTNWVVSLAPGVIFGYLLSSPFGGDGCADVLSIGLRKEDVGQQFAIFIVIGRAGLQAGRT